VSRHRWLSAVPASPDAPPFPPAIVAALLIVFAGVANASAQESASSAASLDRVRAALARPPSTLTLKERTPDFTVHIEKRRPMADIFDVVPWATDPVGWQPPGLGFDLLSLFRNVAKNAAEGKRAYDLRMARKEVRHAIDDYCAAAADAAQAAAARAAAESPQPPQICSTSPSVR
jgi:hypothetical protein